MSARQVERALLRVIKPEPPEAGEEPLIQQARQALRVPAGAAAAAAQIQARRGRVARAVQGKNGTQRMDPVVVAAVLEALLDPHQP